MSYGSECLRTAATFARLHDLPPLFEWNCCGESGNRTHRYPEGGQIYSLLGHHWPRPLHVGGPSLRVTRNASRSSKSDFEVTPALWVHWESNPVHPLKRRVLYLRAMDPIDRAPPFERERGSPLLFTMSKNYRFKRLVGIEPTCSGWQPDAQPMSDSRVSMFRASGQIRTDLVLFTKQVLVPTCIRGVARRERFELSAPGFGGPCPYQWDFRRMW